MELYSISPIVIITSIQLSLYNPALCYQPNSYNTLLHSIIDWQFGLSFSSYHIALLYTRLMHYLTKLRLIKKGTHQTIGAYPNILLKLLREITKHVYSL